MVTELNFYFICVSELLIFRRETKDGQRMPQITPTFDEKEVRSFIRWDYLFILNVERIVRLNIDQLWWPKRAAD